MTLNAAPEIAGHSVGAVFIETSADGKLELLAHFYTCLRDPEGQPVDRPLNSTLGLPAGTGEPGENLRDTLVRKIDEEVAARPSSLAYRYLSDAPYVAGGKNVYPNTSVGVTFTCATSGALIHYATNRAPTASDPSVTSGDSHLFTGLGNSITTIEAMATKTGFPDSALGAAQYYSDGELPTPTPACAAPTFSPVPGNYPASDYPKTIAVKTTTPGASIHYTTNGVTPTASVGQTPTAGNASVPADATLKAVAYKSNLPTSPVTSGKYTVQGVVSTPTINPGSYVGCNTPVDIVVQTTTAGAGIIYTTDGSTPTLTPLNGIKVQSISVNLPPMNPPTEPAFKVVKAMAFKTGMTNSGVITSGEFQLFSPQDCGGGGNGNENDGSATSPVYGANGNLKTGLDGSGYTYDAQNRLLSASKGGVSVSYYYDGLNRQVARTVNGAAIYSVYDGWDLVAEYTAAGLSHAWLYGPGGIVKELTQNLYYFQDGSGSTSHLTDSGGALLEWYRYDLQGKPVFSGDTNATVSAYGVRHLFNGEQWDAALGLYDLRNRAYFVGLGRFLQPDPIGFRGDVNNLYRYCSNSPASRSDPSGLVTQADLGKILTFTPIDVKGDDIPGTPGGVDNPIGRFGNAVDWNSFAEVTHYFEGGDHSGTGFFGGLADPFGIGSGLNVRPIPPVPYYPPYRQPVIHMMIAMMLPPALGEIPFIGRFLIPPIEEGVEAEAATISNLNNVPLSLGTEGLRTELLANGFEEIRTFEGDNGPVSLFNNEDLKFTLYIRSSNELPGAEFFGSLDRVKFTLSGH